MGMKRTLPKVLLFCLMLVGAAAAEPSQPVLLILYYDLPIPFVEQVEHSIEAQLKTTDLPTNVVMRQIDLSSSSENVDWIAAAQEDKPDGTVAVLGLTCDEVNCGLYVLSLSTGAVVTVPIPHGLESGEPCKKAVVATIRETVLGPLLPELKRLAAEASHPSPPPKALDAVLLKSPFESERSTASFKRPWLYLSLGYHGDHPHPGGHPIHGPQLGVDFEITRLLGAGLQFGWLGIREEQVGRASATLQRLDTTLALRLFFALGPARVSLSAIGRVDVAFAKINNVGVADERKAKGELQIGGLTMWHLPLPWTRTFAWVGAGVVVSVIDNEVEVYINSGNKDTAIPSTTVRMIWIVKVAFSPLR